MRVELLDEPRVLGRKLDELLEIGEVVLERSKVSNRRLAAACWAEVRAAPSWSSQNPGRRISASSRSRSAWSLAGSKVVREPRQALAGLREPRGHGLL